MKSIRRVIIRQDITNYPLLSKTSLIVLTRDDVSDSYPFMMELHSILSNDHVCGGSLITTSHVLSAAHCMINETESNILVMKTNMP